MMKANDENRVADDGYADREETLEGGKRGHEEAFPSEAELSMMTKPERKRHREKRRRDRVNASFDELRALLIRIDPQCSNRVDISQLELIDRSIIVIKGLLQEIHRNRDMLRQVNTLEQQGGENTTTKTLSNSVGGNFTVPFVNPFENESQQQTLSMSQQLREAQSTSSAGSIFGAPSQTQQPQQQQATMQATQDQHTAAVHQLLSVAGGVVVGDSSSSHGGISGSSLGHTAQQLLSVPGIIPNTTGGTQQQQQQQQPSPFGIIQNMQQQNQQSTYNNNNPQQHSAPAPTSVDQQNAGTTMNMWTAFSTPIDPDAVPPNSAPV